MRSFTEYLIETIELIEGKVDDLAAQNPDVPVRDYAAKDPTPTKKFLIWLIKQHKLKNITPDESDLTAILKGFDQYKHLHGIQDHSRYTYQQVRDAVIPYLGKLLGKAAKKQQNIEGIEQIYQGSDGIEAFWIKTREASQNLYGGGQKRGGEPGGFRGTTWCTSAKSEGCAFGNYGPMYTIHVPNDDRSPYAVHPQYKVITSRYNDGDKPFENILADVPYLEKSIIAINRHFFRITMKDPQYLFRLFDDWYQNDIDTIHIKYALMYGDEITKIKALNFAYAYPKKITSALILKALYDTNYKIRETAARLATNINKLTPSIIKKLSTDKYWLSFIFTIGNWADYSHIITSDIIIAALNHGDVKTRLNVFKFVKHHNMLFSDIVDKISTDIEMLSELFKHAAYNERFKSLIFPIFIENTLKYGDTEAKNDALSTAVTCKILSPDMVLQSLNDSDDKIKIMAVIKAKIANIITPELLQQIEKTKLNDGTSLSTIL